MDATAAGLASDAIKMDRPGELIVTAADEGFAGLLRGLLGSLAQVGWRGDIAVLDLGLAPASRDAVGAQVRHRITPGWDLPVAADLQARQPQLRALTARPFLRDLIPGYRRYLWIDADAWVQQGWVLDWYLDASEGGRLAVTPQVDAAYLHRRELLEWRLQRLRTGFGTEAAQRGLWETYVNAGVYCLEAGAPHWSRWARHFRRGLEASAGQLCCDQSALNHMLWTERLPLQPLPARCNWLCHLALPGRDAASGLLVEPLRPHAPLGIVHLSAHAKQSVVTLPGEPGRQHDLRWAGGESGRPAPG